MFGIQCTKEARELLEKQNLSQAIDKKLALGPVSIAGVRLGRWCESDLFENWQKVEEEVESGKLTASILGRDAPELELTNYWLNHAVFAYALNKATDYEDDCCSKSYKRHLWYHGNHKAWIWNLDESVLIARANISSRSTPWINLDSGQQTRRIRTMQIDWSAWHRFLTRVLQWAGETGKQEEVQKAFQVTDEEDRMSLEEAIKQGYPNTSDLERELKTMFERPLIVLKRGDKPKIDDFDFNSHLYGTINSSGSCFLPYILEEDGERKLGFAVIPPHSPALVKKFQKKRGSPFFEVQYQHGKEPYWRQLQFSHKELPQLLEGIGKCYNGWRCHIGPILEKFKVKYAERQLATAVL